MTGFHNRMKKGRGPCTRKRVGEPYRRHVRVEGAPEGVTQHVTKGRVFVDRVAGRAITELLSVPPAPLRVFNFDRAKRNSPLTYGGRATTASPVQMTRQIRRQLARKGAAS